MAIVGRRAEIIVQAGLLLFPLVAYFAMVWQYAQNIPHWDDYDAALGFLNTYLKNDSWGSRLELLFSQHNEHRIALTRTLTLLTFLILGKVHFPTLIFIGNLFLLGSVGVLALIHRDYFREPLRGLWYFIPIPLLLINLQFYENTIWAMASLQNFGVLLLGLGALYMLHAPSSWPRFIAAVLLGVAAVYTSGNGILILFIGAWMLWRPGISWTRRAIWILASISVLMLYFWGYTSIPRQMSLTELIGRRPELILNFVLYYLGSWARCFWGIWRLLALAYGLGAILGVVYLLRIRYDRKAPLLFGILLFILMSAGLTAIGRSSENLDSVFFSRYRMYSVLGLGLLYWIFLDLYPEFFQKKVAWLSVLGFTILFQILSFWHGYPHIIQLSHDLKYGMAAHRAGMSQPILSYPSQERARLLLGESEDLGVYNSEKILGEVLNGQVAFALPQETEGDLAYAYEVRVDTGYCRIDLGWAYLKGYSSYNSHIFVVLKSEEEERVFRTLRQLRADVSQAAKNPSLINSGFTFFYPCHKLKPGYYRVGLYVRNVSWLFFGWKKERLEYGSYILIVDKEGAGKVSATG